MTKIIDPSNPDAKLQPAPLDLDAVAFRHQKYLDDDDDDGKDLLTEDVPALIEAAKKLHTREHNLVMILNVKDMEIGALRQCVKQGREALVAFTRMIESRDNSNFKEVTAGLFRMAGIFNTALRHETDHELDEAAVKGKGGPGLKLVED